MPNLAGEEATAEAQRRYKNDIKRQNAFRHAHWMALLTRNGISFDNTMTYAAAHELDTEFEYRARNGWGSKESRIDMQNNRVGAQVGEKVRVSTIVPRFLRNPADDRDIVAPMIQAALNAGRLDLTGT